VNLKNQRVRARVMKTASAAVGVVHIGLGIVPLPQLTAESEGVLVEPWLEVGEILGEESGFDLGEEHFMVPFGMG
jgi:hypothetical protein